MTRTIRGILFDLGDTLLDFGDVNINELFRKGSRLAYDYQAARDHNLPPFERYNRQQMRAVRWKYFLSHITRREFSALDLIDHMNRRAGRKLPREELVQLAWLWYQPLGEQATLEPNLRRTLIDLRGMGLKLGLLSNTFIPGEVLDRHLRQLNLLDLLPVRIYSCDVGVRKPNRRIFELALQRLDVPAPQTLFVGDSPRADIRGANRAGLVSVLKDPSGKYADSSIRSVYRIRRIEELKQILSSS